MARSGMMVRAWSPMSPLVQAADVQRGILQRFLQVVAHLFGAPDAEKAHQLVAAIGHGGQNLPLLLGQLRHVVVEAGDGGAPVRVFHRCEQLDEIERGVGRPVAVVAAVQRELRTEGRELKHEVATRAEGQRRLAARVQRAVENQHQVGPVLLAVAAHRGRQARRSGFLFAVEDDLHVRRDRLRGRFHGVHGGQQRDDRRLVV